MALAKAKQMEEKFATLRGVVFTYSVDHSPTTIKDLAEQAAAEPDEPEEDDD